MKPTIYRLFLLLLFSFFTVSVGCSVNPLSPEALQGDWRMLTFIDKTEGVTFIPGEPVDMGNGETRTINALLAFPETMFETGFTHKNNIILRIWETRTPGLETRRETETTIGTYSIKDSTLTIAIFFRGERTGEIKVFTINRAGFRLTLEDNARQMTWGKVD